MSNDSPVIAQGNIVDEAGRAITVLRAMAQKAESPITREQATRIAEILAFFCAVLSFSSQQIVILPEGWKWSPWEGRGLELTRFLVNPSIEKAVKVSLTLEEIAAPDLAGRLRGIEAEAVRRALALCAP